MSENHPACERCREPVERNRRHYELFERMHWLCFHLEFEHDVDPDVACGDPSCPWWHIEIFREALRAAGHDPDAVLERAIQDRYGQSPNE